MRCWEIDGGLWRGRRRRGGVWEACGCVKWPVEECGGGIQARLWCGGYATRGRGVESIRVYVGQEQY